MTTYVKIDNLNEETFSKVRELFLYDENNYSQVEVTKHLTKLFDNEFDDNMEWMKKNIGSKWIRIEFDDTEYTSEANLIIESAWSVPTEYIQKVVEYLNKYDKDIVAYGTYEDEGYSPIGAFVYGYEYDDIEDYDEVDSDLIWEDDEYNEKTYNELYSLRDSLYEAYLEVKNE